MHRVCKKLHQCSVLTSTSKPTYPSVVQLGPLQRTSKRQVDKDRRAFDASPRCAWGLLMLLTTPITRIPWYQVAKDQRVLDVASKFAWGLPALLRTPLNIHVCALPQVRFLFHRVEWWPPVHKPPIATEPETLHSISIQPYERLPRSVFGSQLDTISA